MFDFFDNRDECRKPGFLRGNIYTSCISMVLLDHFANKNNIFLPLSLSHFLLGSQLPPTPATRIPQLMVPRFVDVRGVWRSSYNHFTIFDGILVVSATLKKNISGFVWLSSATWPFAFKNKIILTLWNARYCDICGGNDDHALSDF